LLGVALLNPDSILLDQVGKELNDESVGPRKGNFNYLSLWPKVKTKEIQ